jgi:hypothetical protein
VSGRAPAAAIAAAVEDVCRATGELSRAAERGDAAAIERAVARRGEAVEALVSLAGAGRLDASERRALRERLALDADQAAGALRQAVQGARTTLQSLAETSRAARSYVAYSGESSALDRSR